MKFKYIKGALTQASTSLATPGPFIVGRTYIINSFSAMDDFTNIGGTNVTGAIFLATGTAATDWTHGSTVSELTAPTFVEKQNDMGPLTLTSGVAGAKITPATPGFDPATISYVLAMAVNSNVGPTHLVCTSDLSTLSATFFNGATFHAEVWIEYGAAV